MLNKIFNKRVHYEDFKLMNETTSMKLKQRIKQITNGQEITLKI